MCFSMSHTIIFEYKFTDPFLSYGVNDSMLDCVLESLVGYILNELSYRITPVSGSIISYPYTCISDGGSMTCASEYFEFSIKFHLVI